MNVLFVCKGNVVRSQIAEALFNDIPGDHRATSAGTQAEEYVNRRLGDYAFSTVRCAKEIGLDLSERSARQLTPEMVTEADRIIVIMADTSSCPGYLLDSPKVEHWQIDDPGGTGYDGHIKARDEVKRRVLGLAKGL